MIEETPISHVEDEWSNTDVLSSTLKHLKDPSPPSRNYRIYAVVLSELVTNSPSCLICFCDFLPLNSLYNFALPHLLNMPHGIPLSFTYLTYSALPPGASLTPFVCEASPPLSIYLPQLFPNLPQAQSIHCDPFSHSGILLVLPGQRIRVFVPDFSGVSS